MPVDRQGLGLEVHDPLTNPAETAGREGSAALPQDLKLMRTLGLGVPYATEALWERLGIGLTLRKVISEAGFGPQYERALLAITANRLYDPESKLGVWDRWLSKVFFPTCSALKLHQMVEAMDLLQQHIEKVENAGLFHTAHLFSLVVDLIFYDTTTASFSIDEKDEDTEATAGFRKYGHSKNGTWTPQVVVALAVTRDGLPVRSWSSQATHPMSRPSRRSGQIFEADSGGNSEENRDELSRACGKYLLATRMGSVSEVKEEVLTKPGRYKVISENLHAKEVVVGDGERRRRYILCTNPREAERQRKHREQVVKVLDRRAREPFGAQGHSRVGH